LRDWADSGGDVATGEEGSFATHASARNSNCRG
jgi:hypothetical protein